MNKLKSKTTTILNDDYQRLEVIGIQTIQVQVEQDGYDAFINLSRNEARQLAEVLIDHCNEAGDDIVYRIESQDREAN